MSSRVQAEIERQHDVLPRGKLLPQEEVQRRLAEHFPDAALGEALVELEVWASSVGYFEHLRESNLFLEYSPRGGVPGLRLQVNYSRLSYRVAQEGPAELCPLCFENIGRAGKEKLRVFEFSLGGTPYFAHPTPFPLHPGHFVLNLRRHEPMRVSAESLREAWEFLKRAPAWLLASNSDVAWAGASVLGHHHFQVFRQLELPLERAEPLARSGRVSTVTLELLRWFGPVARLRGAPEDVLGVASGLMASWKSCDPGRSTFNYLMRRSAHGELVLHLVFRHPAYVSSERLRRIKSEGVGIIEMAGEAIVPPRPGLSRAANEEFFSAHGEAIARAIIAQNSPPCRHFDGLWDIGQLLGVAPDACRTLAKEVSDDACLPLVDP